jgi:group I intron endonuclease
MKHFIYLTTNLINGKKYVGDHSTDNLDDKYLGSGIILKKAIKKHGKENFERKILELFETKEEAFNAQEKYINEYNTLIPYGYNIDKSGGTRPSDKYINIKISIGNKGKIVSADTRKKLSIKFLGKNNPMYNHVYSKETLDKMSENNKGKNNPMFGKKISEEHKEKISYVNSSRIKTPAERKKISKGNTGKTRDKNLRNQISNKLKGRKLSEETIKKMSRPKTQEHKEKIGKSNRGLKRSEEIKLKIKKSIKNVEKIRCSYCGNSFLPWHYSRYHGKKCKNYLDDL